MFIITDQKIYFWNLSTLETSFMRESTHARVFRALDTPSVVSAEIL